MSKVVTFAGYYHNHSITVYVLCKPDMPSYSYDSLTTPGRIAVGQTAWLLP
jgi:hypothetical protein